jgi:hypothetical protein
MLLVIQLFKMTKENVQRAYENYIASGQTELAAAMEAHYDYLKTEVKEEKISKKKVKGE